MVSDIVTGGMGWPPGLVEVVERSITAELATLTRAGSPVTAPATPYLGRSGESIDVSTGLTYPAKAERARRDPRVALLFADPIGRTAEAPVVLVQGLATVRDADLQANTDRYVAMSTDKLPATTEGRPRMVLRRLAWYYARIWIEVTPLHARWWPDRDLAEPAVEWSAPEGTAAPLSDPAPPGRQPRPWQTPVRQWQEQAAEWLRRLPLCDLSVVDANGFPLCVPLAGAELDGSHVRLSMGPGAPELSSGPACLTVHGHDERFTNQENHTLVGSLEGGPHGWQLHVERALGDWSLRGSSIRMSLGFLSKGRVLRGRLRTEAARRSQPVPVVRFPGETPALHSKRPTSSSAS